MPDEQEFLIPIGLAQAVLNYLVQRPYNEVSELVGGLSGLKQAANPKPKGK